MPSTVRMSLARQICTALAPSVIEPPPTLTMISALAARACSVAAITAFARRVRRHLVEGADTTRPERFADFLDLVGVAVQRAADHQECTRQLQAIHLRRKRFRGRRSEHDLVHGAEYDATFTHVTVLPGPWPLRPCTQSSGLDAGRGAKNNWPRGVAPNFVSRRTPHRRCAAIARGSSVASPAHPASDRTIPRRRAR